MISSAPILSLGCCLWVLAAGAASVAFYRNRAGVSVPVGLGARLGAVTGMVAALVTSAFSTISLLLMGSGRMREAVRRGMEQSAARNPDPQAQEMVRGFTQFMTSPGGFALIMTVGFALTFLALTAFAAGGGALGASLFGKREAVMIPLAWLPRPKCQRRNCARRRN